MRLESLQEVAALAPEFVGPLLEKAVHAGDVALAATAIDAGLVLEPGSPTDLVRRSNGVLGMLTGEDCAGGAEVARRWIAELSTRKELMRLVAVAAIEMHNVGLVRLLRDAGLDIEAPAQQPDRPSTLNTLAGEAAMKSPLVLGALLPDYIERLPLGKVPSNSRSRGVDLLAFIADHGSVAPKEGKTLMQVVGERASESLKIDLARRALRFLKVGFASEQLETRTRYPAIAMDLLTYAVTLSDDQKRQLREARFSGVGPVLNMNECTLPGVAALYPSSSHSRAHQARLLERCFTEFGFDPDAPADASGRPLIDMFYVLTVPPLVKVLLAAGADASRATEYSLKSAKDYPEGVAMVRAAQARAAAQRAVDAGRSGQPAAMPS